MFVSYFCACLLVFLLGFWFIYAGTPVIAVLLVTAVSAILGFFLLSVDLGFAGMALIIVNAGAIAMVFLYVCMLARRSAPVARNITPLTFSFSVVFSFIAAYLSTYILNLLCELIPLSKLGLPAESFISVTTRLSDASLSSHLILTVFNASWWPVLIVVGLFLLLAMVVAIHVTKTTEKATSGSFTTPPASRLLFSGPAIRREVVVKRFEMWKSSSLIRQGHFNGFYLLTPRKKRLLKSKTRVSDVVVSPFLHLLPAHECDWWHWWPITSARLPFRSNYSFFRYLPGPGGSSNSGSVLAAITPPRTDRSWVFRPLGYSQKTYFGTDWLCGFRECKKVWEFPLGYRSDDFPIYADCSPAEWRQFVGVLPDRTFAHVTHLHLWTDGHWYGRYLWNHPYGIGIVKLPQPEKVK